MFDRIGQGIYWDRLWRLVDGCTPISPGCENCWSARESTRMAFNPNPKIHLPVAQLTTMSRIGWTGQIRLREGNLDLPLRTKKPQVWLILNDLFHEDVHRDFILRSFIVMRATKQHTFLLLTKRIKRAMEWINEWRPAAEVLADMSLKINLFPNNIRVGTTICNQAEADEKIPFLLQIPAAIRFVSIEPMIAPVDPNVEWGQGVGELALESGRINWVVLGTESGPGRRPANLEWMKNIVQQCKEAGVPIFVKQIEINGKTSKNPEDWPIELRIRELPECK